MRAARLITEAFPGAPVTATMIRSVVSQSSPAAPLRPEEFQDLLFGLVGHEPQGELTQRGEVLGPEEAVQRGGDLVLRINVAVQHPAPQLVRRRIDQLELVGPAHDPVRHSLSHADSGDPFHGVRQRLDVLDVDGGDDGDAGVEDLEYVLPPLLVATRTRHVGVGQLIDEHHRGLAGQDGIEVHLLPGRVAVLDLLASHDGKVPDLLHRVGPLVCFNKPDDYVSPALEPPPSLVQHGARLAHAGRRPEIDAEATGGSDALVLARALGGAAHVHLVSRRHVRSSVHSGAGVMPVDRRL